MDFCIGDWPLRPRADQGQIRGGPRGRGHSFFFEILYYFLWNSQKNKRYLYSWQVGKCPGHPFLSFLDAPLLTVAKLTFPQPVPE